MPGLFAQGLKVDDFGDDVGGWCAASDRAQPNDGREVSAATVEFGEQDGGGRGVARWVDDEWGGLPCVGCEADAVDYGGNLGVQGLAVVDLDGDAAYVWLVAEQGGEVCVLVGCDRMGEVEYEHMGSFLFSVVGRCWGRSMRRMDGRWAR